MYRLYVCIKIQVWMYVRTTMEAKFCVSSNVHVATYICSSVSDSVTLSEYVVCKMKSHAF